MPLRDAGPARITAAAVRPDPTAPDEIEAIVVKFDLTVRQPDGTAETFALDKIYGWDDEGKIEFAPISAWTRSCRAR